MKRIILATIATAFVFFMGTSATLAQDGPPQFRPVEMWACSFRDGKDQEDMNDAYEYFAEEPGPAKYAAFQLNPFMVGNRTENFDFIYVGVWESGSEMGSHMTTYVGADSDANEAWDDTVDCTSLMFASTRIQGPSQNDNGDFVLTISDCNVEHNNSSDQAVGAISRFNDYRVANGVDIGTIVWFPVYGGGNAEFDFKLVNVFTGTQHLGDSFSWYADSQAFNVEGPMMRGVVDCDEARLYTGTTIMNNLQQN